MSGPGADPAPEALVAGRYRVHERIGAGGMGVVHRATDVRLKRDVAIKRVRRDVLDGGTAGDARRRALREAEIAARVHHPRIVSLFDVIDDEDGPLLVLEYLPSRDLGELVGDVGVFPPSVAARAGAQIAEALAAAHAAGIVHRDVKPGNVLVGPGDPLGPVKLTDFGISRPTDVTTLTAGGIGTPAYLAPEVARGEAPTAASDVYALGATLCVAVQGAPPYGWENDNPLGLIRRIAQDPVPRPNVGGPLGELLTRLTATDPDERPSAADAAAELWPLADRPEPEHRVAREAGSTHRRLSAPTWDGHGRRWSRRPVLLAGIGLVLAAAVVAGVVRVTDGSGSTPFPETIPALTIAATDERAADPCALVPPETLRAYGAPTLVPDYGNLATCGIALGPLRGDTLDVGVRFRAASRIDGEPQQLGGATIVREPLSDTGSSCDRNIVLADGKRIEISANFDTDRDTPAPDVCTLAETATAAAARTLADTGVPFRDPPDRPLWAADACALLTPADLTLLPPEDRADRPFRGFAGWECTWDGGSGGQGFAVTLSFDRYDRPDLTGNRVPDTPVYVRRGDGPQRCQAEVPDYTFRGAVGKELAEELRVRVESPRPRPDLCAPAVELARAASARV